MKRKKNESQPQEGRLTRRRFLAGVLGLAGFAAGAGMGRRGGSVPSTPSAASAPGSASLIVGEDSPLNRAHLGLGSVGQVDPAANGGFDPHAFLRHFDYGKVSRLPDGRTLREFRIVCFPREIEVAPGIKYPAWTFNGQVPGPTLRATEGDRVRVEFVNADVYPHTIHFHAIHPAEMDGVFPIVGPGERFVYEFDAEPFGLHLYHCHVMPLRKHIEKGLYGTFIIDPKGGRPPADELVMVMNAFDTDFDGEENEVYAVNTVAFAYQERPIRIQKGELVRVYLVNITEIDPINSFHLHGEFFYVYRTGTRLEPDEYTDTIMMCQGERHILEFRFRYPGLYMFHAHQSEFAELGWTGFFEVVD